MSVLKKQLLILLIVLPTDIAGMIVAQQNVPLFARFVEPAELSRPPINNPRSLSSPPECVGSSIQRIVQNLHNTVIGWRLPDEFVDINVAQDDRHLDFGRPHPKKDLTCAAQLGELGEDEPNRGDHMFVWVDFDLARLTPAEARRQHEAVFSAPRFGVAGGDAPLSQEVSPLFLTGHL